VHAETDTGGNETDLVIPGSAGGVYVEAGMSVEAYRYGEAGNTSERMEAGENG
jgi:hypothetical protein